MGVGDEEAGDEIVLARGHARATLAAAALGAIGRHRHALDVAAVSDGHGHVLARDQVLDVVFELVVEDLRAPRRRELLLDLEQLLAHQREELVAIGQQLEIALDQLGDLAQFLGDLVALQASQALQAQLEDGARLGLGKLVGAVGRHLAARLGDQQDQRRHVGRRPVPGHQAFARHRRIGRPANERDHLVDVGDGNGEADQHVGAVARVVELELGAPGDDLGAEADERLEQLLQVHQPGPPAVQGERVDAERGLQRREAVELVQDDIGHGVALQLDHHPHAVAIALVPDLGDALDPLVAHHLGDALVQARLVLLVGNLRDDDRFAAAAPFLDSRLGPHDDRAAPQLVGRADAVAAQDGGAGREVRARHVLHELGDRHLGIVDQRAAGVDQFTEIVRRDVGRHADGNAARTVGQQVGECRRQNHRLQGRLVVVRLEIDGVLADVRQQRLGDPGQPRLGITHGRRRIGIHRTEVALPRDQRQAHGEILRHAHQRVVDRLVAVRVILAHHLADDARRLAEGMRGIEAAFLHRVQDAALHRLQAVAGIGQRARHDHAHRVIEVGATHLLFDRDRLDIVRRLLRRGHVGGRRRRRKGRFVAQGNLGFARYFGPAGGSGGTSSHPIKPGPEHQQKTHFRPVFNHLILLAKLSSKKDAGKVVNCPQNQVCLPLPWRFSTWGASFSTGTRAISTGS